MFWFNLNLCINLFWRGIFDLVLWSEVIHSKYMKNNPLDVSSRKPVKSARNASKYGEDLLNLKSMVWFWFGFKN